MRRTITMTTLRRDLQDDLTTPARALVLSTHGLNSDTPETSWATFDEEPSARDPHLRAEAFILSFADDDHWDSHTIVLNARARYLMWRRRMKDMLDLPDSELTEDHYREVH